MSNPMRMGHHAAAIHLDAPMVNGLTKRQWQAELNPGEKKAIIALYNQKIAFFVASGGGFFTKGVRFKILTRTADSLIAAGLAQQIHPSKYTALVLTAHGKDIATLLKGRMI